MMNRRHLFQSTAALALIAVRPPRERERVYQFSASKDLFFRSEELGDEYGNPGLIEYQWVS